MHITHFNCLYVSSLSEWYSVISSPDTKEDGGWTTWENWAYCSLTCGSGTQSRARACSSPTPNNGGDDCIGDSTETKACSVTDCPGKHIIRTCNYYYSSRKLETFSAVKNENFIGTFFYFLKRHEASLLW